jgi:hypothetical protein
VTLIGSVVLSLTVLIAGCSSETSADPERAAEAPAEDLAGDEPPVPEFESGELLEEPLLVSSGAESSTVTGVTFCVLNKSSSQTLVSLEAVMSSGNESRILERGDELCMTGSALFGKDIRGNISVDNVGPVMEIEASRPALWLSWVHLIQPEYGRCVYNSYFQNAGSTVQDGVLQYEIKRGKDTETTNFRLTLADPKKKSPNGQTVKCT